MRILAIETAARLGSVALVDKGKLVAASSLDGGKGGHSRWLVPAVERVMGDAGWTAASLDAVAVNRGPGSFTGIRIGVATAQGLAVGWDRPLVGVHGLEALAWQAVAPAAAPAQKRTPLAVVVIPMVDARHGNVYGAVYGWKNHDRLDLPPEEGVPPALYSAGELLQAVRAALEGPEAMIALAGDGGVLYEPMAKQVLGDGVRPVPLDGDRLRAETVARWAERLWNAGLAEGDPAAVQPLYLRKPEAERKWANPAHP